VSPRAVKSAGNINVSQQLSQRLEQSERLLLQLDEARAAEQGKALADAVAAKDAERAAEVARLQREAADAAARLAEEGSAAARRLEALRAAWADDTSRQLALRDQQHAAALAAERARATQAEEAETRWKKALREAENATAVMARAMAQHQEQRRDAADADRVVAAGGGPGRGGDSLSAFLGADDVEDTRVALARLRAEMMQEQAAAVARAEVAVREHVSAEWAERLRQEVDAAWAQASAVGEAKVAKLEELAQASERGLEGKLQALAAQVRPFMDPIQAPIYALY